MSREQRAIEAAMRRRVQQMEPEHQEAMEAANAAADDWRGDCIICKKKIVGTRDQLMKHGRECVASAG